MNMGVRLTDGVHEVRNQISDRNLANEGAGHFVWANNFWLSVFAFQSQGELL